MTESGPLRRRERLILIGLTVVIAATRLMPLARSMWDWDEALFCLALHDFNVAAHHPHPPGFPLYIAAGRLMRLLIHDDFRALRTISLLSSIFLFPTLVALGRAFRFPFAIAASAGVLFVFLPNVWFHGGTAFSDIFNLVLLLAGLALLSSKPRNLETSSPRSRYLLGTLVFSLSLLVRPQNVLCAYPWFAASWARARGKRWGEIAAAALLSVVVVASGYGLAARATGVRAFVDAVRGHQHYIATVDGFKNPNRPSPLALFPSFVIDPFAGGRAMWLLFGFAVLALVIPKKRDAEAMATFVPVLVFTLFMLNPTGSSRLSLAYMPLLALLAADGIARAGLGMALLMRRPRAALVAQVLGVAVFAGQFMAWCAPAFRELKAHDSPPVQAIRWAMANVPRSATFYIDGGYGPHAEYYLKSYDTHFVDGEGELAALPLLRNAWYIADRPSRSANAVNFRRPRKKLWNLFTQRYFESSVRPLEGTIRFLDGWYDEESTGEESWRWMGRRARIVLQPIPAGGELRFTATVPIDIEAPPEVTVFVDGQAVDRFLAAANPIARRYPLPPSPVAHEVVFELSHAVNPAGEHRGGDRRDLGMQLRTISWQP